MCSCRKDDELIMKMTTKEFLENANAEMGRKVWEHYGEEAQTKKLVEELAELITAIARDDIRAIREEMADVEVMIMQFKQAENCDRYLHKGKQVAVSGRIQTGSYKNKEGQTIYTTDVIANNVEFLGSSQQSTLRQPDEAYSDSAPNYQEALPDGFEATEEDIPF